MKTLAAIGIACLAAAGCRGGEETRGGDAATVDDAEEVLSAVSACDRGGPAASGRARDLRTLRAWLDGAELPAAIGVATEPRPKDDAALVARGKALYDRDCATCHGDKGAGDGPRTHSLEDAPGDLTSGAFELRSTETGSLPTDEDLFRTISRGEHGTAMAPWFLLPEKDRWALVAYVKTLSPAFADDEAPPPLAIGEPPPATPELTARGDALFHSAGCSSCHGDQAHGDGPAAAALKRHPRNLTGIHFHRASDVRSIFQTITTGLDGTPMASFAKVMPEEDRWAVATYVHGLVPPFTDGPDGLRCPARADRVGDELVGMRAMLRRVAASE